ncbi:formate dehydrogenase subunit gamma [biofilm metagenome]
MPTVQEIINNFKEMPGALLPILHGIQDKCGYIPDETVPEIANALNLSRAEVHGVISFYHYFRETPPGRTTIHVCRAESCQAMGSHALENHVKQKLGIDYHETTADGAFSLEPVYCLGLCSCSPSMQVGEEVYGKVTPEVFDEVIGDARANG